MQEKLGGKGLNENRKTKIIYIYKKLDKIRIKAYNKNKCKIS